MQWPWKMNCLFGLWKLICRTPHAEPRSCVTAAAQRDVPLSIQSLVKLGMEYQTGESIVVPLAENELLSWWATSITLKSLSRRGHRALVASLLNTNCSKSPHRPTDRGFWNQEIIHFLLMAGLQKEKQVNDGLRLKGNATRFFLGKEHFVKSKPLRSYSALWEAELHFCDLAITTE